MAKNSKLTGVELNGILYSLGKSIYEELDMSLERFAELLGRDLYCPTLNAAPTSSILTYTDTDGSVNTFQVGQPCRWADGNSYRIAVCTNITASASSWYVFPIKVSELSNDAGYLTQHQDISGKQDVISDLATIRSGAAKGATALQSVPSEYVTETELTGKGYATTSDMNTALGNKVDKVSGKGLSTNDFTTALKTKLEGLSNYDDTTISNAIETLRDDFDNLVSGDTTTAIKSFNDIVAFLDGLSDSEDLDGIISSIEQQIAAKQDTISDLATIRSGAAKGATALQSYTEKYTGTITGIKMNGASKGTSGVVDLGTVITAHQDISGKLDSTTAASTYLSKTDAASTYLGKTAKAASATKADSATTAGACTGNSATATKATQDASGNVITTTYATKTEVNNKQDKVLKFTNLTASAWVSDSTYTDFPYRCDVTCSGVTASNYAEVVFALEQATSGSYAPLCETKTNAVSVWSAENTSITIPTILVTI